MVSAQAARNIVGVVGNVISFGLFLSPVPTFCRIIKNKAVEDYSPIPYIATVMNCMFWIFYGMPFVHPNSLLVVTINGVGLGLELIYLAIFYSYAQKQKNARKKIIFGLAGEVAFVAVVAAITMLLFHTHTRRTMLVGIICDIFNIIMYGSPLTVMKMVIKTKSVKYMPFFLSLANFLNGSVWTAYALIIFDPYILASNGIGVVFGAAQLLLYAWYYRTTPKDEDDFSPTKPTEVQISSTNATNRV